MADMDMNALFSKMPSLRLTIGVVAFFVLVLSGIGAVMAWVPNSTEVTGDSVVVNNLPALPEVDPPASQKCMECGVVESSRTIVRDEEDIDRNAASRVKLGGLNEMPGKAVKMSEVTVRLNDGTTHQFADANLTNWRPGERLIFIEGVSSSTH